MSTIEFAPPTTEDSLGPTPSAEPLVPPRRHRPPPPPNRPWRFQRPVRDPGAPRRRLRPDPGLAPSAGIQTWVFASVSLLLAWLVLFSLVVSSLQHSHRQGVLYSQLREQLALETAPLGGVIRPGAPVGLLDFSAIGLHHEVLVEGTAAGDLISGPGHRRDTPLPGQAGVSIILGRANLFGGPFGHLARAKPGDVLTVTVGEGVAKFLVIDVRHVGDPKPAPLRTGQAGLIFVSADGSGWRSGWAPTGTIYVDAVMQGDAFATPGPRLPGVPKAELPMRNDPSALFTLVLWLPLLLIGLVGGVWAATRWGRWQAWLVSVPVVLAALWGVSESAVQLLPNLM